MQHHRTSWVRAAYHAALFSFALAVLATAGAFAAAQSAMAGAQMARETLKIASGEASTHTFNVEVARTSQEKAHGLMFRTTLPAGTGMLFPYEEATEIQMWMRNTYIPLDMVFIRADGRVHRIEAHTEPMSEKLISSNGDVTAVLEIAAGEAARLGLKPGDLVKHEHFGTAKSNQ